MSCPVYTCTMYIHVCTSIYTVCTTCTLATDGEKTHSAYSVTIRKHLYSPIWFLKAMMKEKQSFTENILRILRFFTPPVCVSFSLPCGGKLV